MPIKYQNLSKFIKKLSGMLFKKDDWFLKESSKINPVLP